MKMDSVDGKVVLVTGGLGGIGSAIIKALLQNGAKGVAILDISEEKSTIFLQELSHTFGPNKAIFIKTDVTNKTEIKNAFESTIQTFKQLDIVINNAGIVNEFNRDLTVALNLSATIEGTFLAFQEYLPKYKSTNEGVIINVASILGLYSSHCSPVYCATKHAIIGLGRALGQDIPYEDHKVRVLTICPGVTESNLSNLDYLSKNALYPLNTKFINETKQKPECVAEAIIKMIKVGRNGSVWVSESNEVYEIEIPYYRKLKK